jgi:hypothetical protein
LALALALAPAPLLPSWQALAAVEEKKLEKE